MINLFSLVPIFFKAADHLSFDILEMLFEILVLFCDIMAEIKKMYNYNDSESVSDLIETYQRIKKFLSSFLDKQIEGTFKKGFFDEIGEYKFVPFKFIIYFGVL